MWSIVLFVENETWTAPSCEGAVLSIMVLVEKRRNASVSHKPMKCHCSTNKLVSVLCAKRSLFTTSHASILRPILVWLQLIWRKCHGCNFSELYRASLIPMQYWLLHNWLAKTKMSNNLRNSKIKSIHTGAKLAISARYHNLRIPFFI